MFRPVIRKGQQALQVLNYVGILSLPSGSSIEILPKTTEVESEKKSRQCLFKMLARVNDLPFTKFNDADLGVFERPLLEILIGRFLQTVQHLINKGLRSQYIRVDGEEAFLKGKLRVGDHLRNPPHKRHFFPIEYDAYLLTRPENRLLHWAVNQVYHWSRDGIHRSHARKILTLLSEVPRSNDPLADLKAWQDDRLMQHYAPVKVWIELIVKGISPWTQIGSVRGISLLYPMEQLFEKYVFQVIREQTQNGYTVRAQSYAGWLAHHSGKDFFRLQPDIIIQKGETRVGVLDTKWKLLDQENARQKYGISQADMYQLFAYSQKCLPSGGNLFLVYPKTSQFSKPLPEFSFSNMHRLWVVPFCLETDSLINLKWPEDEPFLTGNRSA
ncbi:MAG: McrC family protein [Micavibrio aeruginosavorus]|uniref:McrC family protein n=1 Tax=Micavibrio aeruginosavorus TaxID=349221 RepID=A0A7T5R3E2_9BACT|nr:MAG: McrC family protein [Micavibrio aeruginosavorus]